LRAIGIYLVGFIVCFIFVNLNLFGWVFGLGLNGYVARSEYIEVLGVPMGSAWDVENLDKYVDYNFRDRWPDPQVTDRKAAAAAIMTRPRFMVWNANGDWKERKHIRIEYALETARINMTDLWDTLSDLKQGKRNFPLFHGYVDPMPGIHRPPPDPHTADYVEWVRPLDMNYLVPMVKVRADGLGMEDPLNTSSTDPNSGTRLYVTWYADMFSKYPPLSENQLIAEAELYRTGDLAFWLGMAQQNGIWNYDKIHTAWAARDRSVPEWAADVPDAIKNRIQ
jgi:hypothetical protein